MKIIIAGGTGLIGRGLIETLIHGDHRVFILSRRAHQKDLFPSEKIQTLFWNGKDTGEWVRCLEDADAVINLSGEGVADKRWTSARKALLRSSRLEPTRTLVKAISQCARKPKVFVSASAVGYYGSVPEGEVDETHARGSGFLAELSAEWEAAAMEAKAYGVRVVIPRIGIVLEPKQGALAKMMAPFHFYAGGTLGSGSQWVPWVHIHDLVGMILFSMSRHTVEGCFNACAPNPVRMKDFCGALGRVLESPSWLPVPALVLRLVLGEMAEMIVTGQRAIPRKMLRESFHFRHRVLESSLVALLAGPR